MSPVDLSARVRDVGVQTDSWQALSERALLLEVVLAAMRGDYSGATSEAADRKRLLQNLFRLSVDTCSQLLGKVYHRVKYLKTATTLDCTIL